jgi:hypothetical protein
MLYADTLSPVIIKHRFYRSFSGAVISENYRIPLHSESPFLFIASLALLNPQHERLFICNILILVVKPLNYTRTIGHEFIYLIQD